LALDVCHKQRGYRETAPSPTAQVGSN
jgi:hypothetical protein